MLNGLFSRTYVTLNINAGDIRAFSMKGGRVKKWGSTPLAPGLVRDGLILQPNAVAEAIHLLFETMGIPKKRVIVSVTGLSFTYRILSLPHVDSEVLDEAIKRAAKREMPLPVDELYLSWQVIAQRDDESDFFVLGVPRNLVTAVVETLTGAGIKPYIMDLKPLALARAPAKNDAIVVSMEPECFDIVLSVNGITEVMHAVTPKTEGATIHDHVRQLTDELSRTVKYYNSGHSEDPLSADTPLLLTGQLATNSATTELIQAEMEYPVKPLVPPLHFQPELPVALYATNMGLALRKIRATNGFHDTQLNILAGTYQTKHVHISLKNVIPYCVLAVIAGLLIPFFQFKNDAVAETARLESELNTVTHELNLAELALSRAAAGEADAEVLVNQMAAVLQALQQEHMMMLAGAGDFAGNLGLVTGLLPSQASFTAVEMDRYSIMIEGIVDNPFTVLSYARALEAEAFVETRIAEIDEVVVPGEDSLIYYFIDITR
ncbi:MAG TPA: pilus assembly protein PilM [Dehalococcoidia bacterium]|nr:pilus assembly protein PilM [Dehalococcoidia bacterium]